MDIINVEILEDGTVSLSTGKVSDANHFAADELLEVLEKEIGVLHMKRDIKHAHVHGGHFHSHKAEVKA